MRVNKYNYSVFYGKKKTIHTNRKIFLGLKVKLRRSRQINIITDLNVNNIETII